MSDTPRLYSTKEVAARLGVDASHVRRLAAQLGIGRKMGRDWFFTDADIAVLQERPHTRQRCRPTTG